MVMEDIELKHLRKLNIYSLNAKFNAIISYIPEIDSIVIKDYYKLFFPFIYLLLVKSFFLY